MENSRLNFIFHWH